MIRDSKNRNSYNDKLQRNTAKICISHTYSDNQLIKCLNCVLKKMPEEIQTKSLTIWNVLQPIHDCQTSLLIKDPLLLIGPLLLTQIKLGLKKVNQQ